MPIPISDSELVRKVVNSDEGAFLALYDRFASRVYGLTLRVLGDSMLAGLSIWNYSIGCFIKMFWGLSVYSVYDLLIFNSTRLNWSARNQYLM